ncbi:hypothetical protein LCGC14_2477450, partial [marine sediment metagenome]
MNNKVVIVVGAVDKYSAAWPIFAHGFKKYWPDCPWEIVAITNEKDFPIGRTIKIGKDRSWGETVRKGLEKINSDVILWVMEDYFVSGPVKGQIMENYAQLLLDNKVDHIRILPPAVGLSEGGTQDPTIECKCKYENIPNEADKYLTRQLGFKENLIENLWIFKDDAEYRASLATSLWRKDKFLEWIEDGMTPWQFEHDAGIKSRGNDRHLCCVRDDVLCWPWRTNPYPNGKCSPIRKGQWTGAAHEYVKYEKLDIDLQWHPNGARVASSVRIRDWFHFYIGKNSIIDDFCYISTRVEMGKHSHIA